METQELYINDKKARLIGMPLISLLTTIAYHNNNFDLFSRVVLTGFSISFLNTFLIWEGTRIIFYKARKKYPNVEQTRKRLIYQSCIAIFYTLVITLAIDVFCYQLQPKDQFKPFTSFLIGLFANFIVTLLYETVFFFESWKMNVRKTEALARENVQSQLESLKSQLDPHFLFNTLNTLSFLIADNTQAQKYLEHLSDVYRYVLVSREKDTVSLSEEMGFVEAYMYLNKIRFQENLQLENTISAKNLSRQVIPLSLQMLVENAIKHNIVSKEKPLKISISENENYLIVENNLQEKKIFEKSTKIGLRNIRNRYELLTSKLILIEKNESIFRVELPLL
jgi:two-component system, LytTR family, sensor kinase